MPEPIKPEETNLEKKEQNFKPESELGSTIRNAFGLKPKKETAKEPDKKPEVKPEVKPETKVDEKPEEPKAEEFITLKVVGKEKKVPIAERDMWMQKGLDYDFQKSEAANAKAALLRVAKLEGFDTVDKYLAELDNREKVKLAERVEEAAGDPDKINEIVENHPKVVETREKDRKNVYRDIKAELSKDQFFKELEPELDRVMEQNPAASPDLVYNVIRSRFLTPDKIKELITKEKDSAVKATIADIHDKERRTEKKGGDADDGTEELARPTAVMSEIAKAFGVSANKVAQRIMKSNNKK